MCIRDSSSAGTDCYKPIENEITEKTDIYSIGLIITFLLCYGREQTPIKKEIDLIKLKDINHRSECIEFMSKNISKDFFAIIKSLVDMDHNCRPTAIEALQKIKDLDKKISLNKNANKHLDPYISCLLYTSPSPRD